MSYLHDAIRIKALTDSGLLSKGVQERLCHLAFTAARLTGADMAQVNVLDDQHQFHVCQWPVPEPGEEMVEAAESSGCKEVVLSGETLIIPDTRDHPLTCDLPWIRSWGAYLGTPITYDGQVIGAMCVLAVEERRWTMRDQMAVDGVCRLLVMSLD